LISSVNVAGPKDLIEEIRMDRL